MSQYVFKFYKLDDMRFISHLDLQRLFTRAMRRAKIGLVYSFGYNPHPKISIIQPLSLGFETTCDYFEIETEKEENTEEMLCKINEALPIGIKFIEGMVLPFSNKSLSSIVEFSSYEVYLPLKQTEGISDQIHAFCEQNIITVNKRDKKTKKVTKKDIKSFIRSLALASFFEDGVILKMILRSATNESLNPLNLMESFCDFINEPFNKDFCRVCRKDIYLSTEKELCSLWDYLCIDKF